MNFNAKNIIKYVKCYDCQYNEKAKKTEMELKKWLKRHDHLTKEKFLEICCWKAPRAFHHFKANSENEIIELTRKSFKASDECARIVSLVELNGVGYPIASAILHFKFPNKYPILDFRALESLGYKKRMTYNCKFWQEYVDKLRGLSKRFHVSMRELDKALWAHSKAISKSKRNQSRGSK